MCPLRCMLDIERTLWPIRNLQKETDGYQMERDQVQVKWQEGERGGHIDRVIVLLMGTVHQVEQEHQRHHVQRLVGRKQNLPISTLHHNNLRDR
jgi:hypothetical protein